MGVADPDLEPAPEYFFFFLSLARFTKQTSKTTNKCSISVCFYFAQVDKLVFLQHQAIFTVCSAQLLIDITSLLLYVCQTTIPKVPLIFGVQYKLSRTGNGRISAYLKPLYIILFILTNRKKKRKRQWEREGQERGEDSER